MTTPETPRLDTRRADDFRRELTERAGAWIRDWNVDERAGGFGRALLDVAAHFNAAVAERLDRAGEKLSLGLLDWLALRGMAARPARVPVVFKLADNATEPVLASQPVRLQTDVAGASVVFETESDVQLLPGKLEALVGVDTTDDRYFLPPPGLSSLDPLEPMPTQWRTKAFVPTGSAYVQLDPALGIEKDMLLEIAGGQYRVVSVDGDLVRLDPSLAVADGIAENTEVTKVQSFDPFGQARNRQDHIVYLGDPDLFNIEAPATFEIHGAGTSLSEATWEYFGKSEGEGGDEAKWRELSPRDRAAVPLILEKPRGAIEVTKIGNVDPSRWIRARQQKVASADGILFTEGLTVVVNRGAAAGECPPPGDAAAGAPAEGFANTTALSFAAAFYPLGREPRQFDTFFLGCTDALSKDAATVSICFEMSDPAANSFSPWREGLFSGRLLASVGGDYALHLIEMKPSDGSLKPLLGHGPLQPRTGAGSISLDRKPRFRLPTWAVNDPDNGVQTVPTKIDLILVQPIAFTSNFFAGIFGLFTKFPFFVATTAGSSVWVWKEYPFLKGLSRWIPFGSLPSATNQGPIDGLVYLRDNVGGPHATTGVTHSLLLATIDGALYMHSALERRAGDPWRPVTITGAAGTPETRGPAFKLKAIVPVNSMDGEDRWHGTIEDGLVGVYTDGTESYVNHIRFTVSALGDAVTGATCQELDGTQAAKDARPVAARRNNTPDPTLVRLYVFWQTSDAVPKVRAIELELDRDANTLVERADNVTTPDPQTSPTSLEGFTLEIQPFPPTFTETPTVIASGQRDGASYVVSWTPFPPGIPSDPDEAPLPTGSGPLGGAPAIAGNFIVVPGTQSDAWVARWDPAQRRTITANPLGTGVVAPAVFPALVQHDFVGFIDGSTIRLRQVTDFGSVMGGERLSLLDDRLGIGATANALVFVYRRAISFTGTNPAGVYHLELQQNDVAAIDDQWLVVQNITTGTNPRLAQITDIDKTGSKWKVKLSSQPSSAAGQQISYWYPQPLDGRLAPVFDLDPNADGNWDVALLDRVDLVFAGKDPERQQGKAFKIVNGHPQRVALAQNWKVSPGPSATFVLDASIGAWTRQLGDNSSNPELSWEYWNGTSWWPLALTSEETLNLKRTGRVEFTVPDDLAPTDVNGSTNHWIRARLIGGDYGRESVKVVTRPVGTDGATEQTIVRTPAEISPPLVVNMRIRYSLEHAVTPQYLQTEDAATLRDQSDANRAPGPMVEAFVPLAVQIGRLERAAGASDAPAPGAPSCECGGKPTAAAGTATAETGTSAISGGAPVSLVPRSVLLGFSARLKGGPVNVLLLVEERAYDALAPLVVEALINDRFEAVTVQDRTRALGESGLLSLSFPVVPSPRELFGQALTWLRLSPSQASQEWQPVIRGAYLNAAWASARETLTREALGSSDGRPHLTVQVARPPLLAGTLELRVREPLDDEERAALLDDDPASVKSREPDLPGDWVLWRQVPDPDDWGPDERVYSLDEQSGEIEFGDGMHGMIPPIGRDSIVAFTYQRTEPPAGAGDELPANLVTERAALQLVTPVDGVEAAFAADHAAGGAQPEPDARVLRFGSARLRHRQRAIAPEDFEDLALQSSSDVAQARALRTTQGLRVVVVMRGQKPNPGAAQRRELLRLLKSAASPLLGGRGAIEIVGPRVRRLRLHLSLRVATLDDAGQVGKSVQLALTKLFDTASGGLTGSGWPLGVAPTDEDIASALEGIAGLAGIGDIVLKEVGAEGTESAWRPTLRADQLVMLAEDAFRIRYEPLEVAA